MRGGIRIARPGEDDITQVYKIVSDLEGVVRVISRLEVID